MVLFKLTYYLYPVIIYSWDHRIILLLKKVWGNKWILSTYNGYTKNLVIPSLDWFNGDESRTKKLYDTFQYPRTYSTEKVWSHVIDSSFSTTVTYVHTVTITVVPGKDVQGHERWKVSR